MTSDLLGAVVHFLDLLREHRRCTNPKGPVFEKDAAPYRSLQESVFKSRGVPEVFGKVPLSGKSTLLPTNITQLIPKINSG